MRAPSTYLAPGGTLLRLPYTMILKHTARLLATLFLALPAASLLAQPAATTLPLALPTTEANTMVYPRQALLENLQGTVSMAFLVDADGTVLAATVEQTSGTLMLDAAAIDGMRKRGFSPGLANGKPVRSWTKVQYVWSIDSEEDVVKPEVLRAAAETGDANAQMRYALLLSSRWSLRASMAEVLRWYRAAALGGNGEAQERMGARALYDTAQPDNGEEVLGWLMRPAAQERVKVLYSLGTMYHRAWKVQTDMAQAVKWYTRAADKGFTKAQYRLAQLYLAGDGVGQDSAVAVSWYRKAVEGNLPDAQVALAQMLLRGDVVADDPEQAMRLLDKAVEQDFPPALYLRGEQLMAQAQAPQETAAAVAWTARAASLGHDAAQYRLAQAYETGKGLTQDGSLAVVWYELAAQTGHVEAMQRLLAVYRDGGLGQAADAAKAQVWQARLDGMRGKMP
jgi:TonB family protein